MALFDLVPQFFFPTEVTLLPHIDFYELAKSKLPQVYQNANNFMAVVRVISNNKQKLYDTIRSLVNVFNLNNGGNGTGSAIPRGIFLEMLASIVQAPYSPNSSSFEILTSVRNTFNFVNSRGRPADFYTYFSNNNLGGYFTNAGVQDFGNATIFFNVPVLSATPLNPPSPTEIFLNAMNKLKAAGIDIVLTAANVPFFQFGSLPTLLNPISVVAPGNAGFGGLDAEDRIVGGGYFQSLI